jgi:hypothetical protein
VSKILMLRPRLSMASAVSTKPPSSSTSVANAYAAGSSTTVIPHGTGCCLPYMLRCTHRTCVTLNNITQNMCYTLQFSPENTYGRALRKGGRALLGTVAYCKRMLLVHPVQCELLCELLLAACSASGV